jgi:hypothetical protein
MVTRERFRTGPAPLNGGSTSGKVRWAQMPEKSGMAAVFRAPLSAGRLAGVAVCARAGIAAAKHKKPIDVKAITVVEVMTYPCEFAQSHMIAWRAQKISGTQC